MNINETFPSNYLKASDLQGREIILTMAGVEMQTIGDDHKPVLFFQGKQKGVVLNKTNAMNIAAAYGPDTDGWTSKQVVLFSVWTDFQGKSVQGIRIRPAGNPQVPQQRQAVPVPAQPASGNPQVPQQRQAVPVPAQPASGYPDLNDDVPFAPSFF